MIIFAVLLDPTGITHHQENGTVVAGTGAASSTATSDMAESSGPGMVVVRQNLGPLAVQRLCCDGTCSH